MNDDDDITDLGGGGGGGFSPSANVEPIMDEGASQQAVRFRIDQSAGGRRR